MLAAMDTSFRYKVLVETGTTSTVVDEATLPEIDEDGALYIAHASGLYCAAAGQWISWDAQDDKDDKDDASEDRPPNDRRTFIVELDTADATLPHKVLHFALGASSDPTAAVAYEATDRPPNDRRTFIVELDTADATLPDKVLHFALGASSDPTAAFAYETTDVLPQDWDDQPVICAGTNLSPEVDDHCNCSPTPLYGNW